MRVGGIWQLKIISNISTIHNVEGHDQGYHARSRLHGGLSRSEQLKAQDKRCYPLTQATNKLFALIQDAG